MGRQHGRSKPKKAEHDEKEEKQSKNSRALADNDREEDKAAKDKRKKRSRSVDPQDGSAAAMDTSNHPQDKQQEMEEDKAMTMQLDGNDNNRSATKPLPTTTNQVHPLSFASAQPALSQDVLDFCHAQKFHSMTPVQAATIPLFLSHKDVAVQACTGSGKTLSFLIPIVEMILRRQAGAFAKNQVAALVLSPTRELALQTFAVAKDLCAAVTGMKRPLLLVGGGGGGSGCSNNHRPVTQDLQAFASQGNDIVIATPGRLEDILSRYMVMDVSELECLVLDEADVLLKMGFAISLTNILSKLPKMRRTGLFSATAVGLKEWIPRAGMRNPVWVNVTVTSSQRDNANNQSTADQESHQQEQATPASLTNYYMITTLEERLSRLVSFLKSHKEEQIIVFFLTCASVEFFGSALQALLPDHYIELLHGKLVQKRREKAMERFRECHQNSASSLNNNSHYKTSHAGVLCCTDVAARGLDVTSLEWVVQFDAPQDPAFYVHRVGRAARAGRTGSSLLFLTRKEEPYVDFLRMRKVPLKPLPTSEVCCPPLPTDKDDGNDEKYQDRSNKRKASKQENVNEPESDDNQQNEQGEPPQKRIIQSAADMDQSIEDVLPKLRKLLLKDRDMLEKGTKAFTSYIRAYKEHQCAFIFRFASLDLGRLATSFCLLRLPKMPELRDILIRHKGKLPNFESAGAEIDIYAIPYQDKVREVARQKRLQAELAAGGKNAKQIKAEQRKAQKLQKEKDRRKDAIQKGRNPDKKRGKNAQMMDEWDELAKEERLYKKLRRGKITQSEFDEQMFGDAAKAATTTAS